MLQANIFRVMRRTLRTSAAQFSSSVADDSDNHYDIIIGGGGLVGTTLAVALSSNKALAEKRILLLEGSAPYNSLRNSGYGNRVSAINKNTVELFKSIDVWDAILAERVKPVKQMQVWDACSDASIQFQHQQFADDVACIVENDLMLEKVLEKLETIDNVELRNEARIASVQLQSDTKANYNEVELKSGDSFSCELLIGADGANSLIRKQMAVDVFTINYERKGVVATLELSESCENSVAWQRFLPSGPIALLPLNEKLSSLVWSTSVPHAEQLLGMSEHDFVRAINEAFCKEYPKNDLAVKAVNALNSFMGQGNLQQQRQYPPRIVSELQSSRASFPLGFLHAASYVCTGAALIGDAAHRIHPLAGQGLNLGFSDVRFMVEALSNAAYAGAKLSDKQYLTKYEQKCLAKNVPIMIGVHSLEKLYSTIFTPVVLLRSLGLQLTQNIPQIKELFMKRAIN